MKKWERIREISRKTEILLTLFLLIFIIMNKILQNYEKEKNEEEQKWND